MSYKKNSRTLGLFYKIRYYVPLEILKQLYYSLFYSFVSYRITVWGLGSGDLPASHLFRSCDSKENSQGYDIQ